MLHYTFRPLGPWVEGNTDPRRSRYSFKATWPATLDLLECELGRLDARLVVLAADFTETDIRLDGMPRANARQPVHPGVRIAFESRHGPLTYATDAYEDWKHNVRAIALALEALRAVDRYGVTRRGEQYTGWAQLGAGAAAAADTAMSRGDALHLVHRLAGAPPASNPAGWDPAGWDPDELARAFRRARGNAHPDRHEGRSAAFLALGDAGRVLGLIT